MEEFLLAKEPTGKGFIREEKVVWNFYEPEGRIKYPFEKDTDCVEATLSEYSEVEVNKDGVLIFPEDRAYPGSGQVTISGTFRPKYPVEEKRYFLVYSRQRYIGDILCEPMFDYTKESYMLTDQEVRKYNINTKAVDEGKRVETTIGRRREAKRGIVESRMIHLDKFRYGTPFDVKDLAVTYERFFKDIYRWKPRDCREIISITVPKMPCEITLNISGFNAGEFPASGGTFDFTGEPVLNDIGQHMWSRYNKDEHGIWSKLNQDRFLQSARLTPISRMAMTGDVEVTMKFYTLSPWFSGC